MKRLFLWMFAASVLLLPSSSFAQGSFTAPSVKEAREEARGFSGIIHTGPNLRLRNDSPTDVGFGVDIFPGYQFGRLFTAELNLGLHFVKETQLNGAVTTRDWYIPVFVPGFRTRWPVVSWFEPWLSFHLGIALIHSKSSGGSPQVSESQTPSAFTFNTGLGVDFWVNETVAVTVAGRYRFYSPARAGSLIDVSVGTALKF